MFTTDGAPAAEFFWRRYGSREHYAAVRHPEALESLEVIGITGATFLEDALMRVRFHDQELFRGLPPAIQALEELAHHFKPDALVAPAYEGGHPDHGACSVLVSAVDQSLAIPRWEMPLYHRSPTGALVHQKFRIPLGGEIILNPTQLELRRRDEMLKKYVSQLDISMFVTARMKSFRPQPNYDYSRPPHLGPLNYEVWGWPMTGPQLCTAFRCCGMNPAAIRQHESQQKYSWAGCNLNRADTVLALQAVL